MKSPNGESLIGILSMIKMNNNDQGNLNSDAGISDLDTKDQSALTT